MRGQAGPDRRVSVVLGPLQNPRQALPVRLVHQVRRPRLCPGHDEAVEMAVPQIVDAGIEAAHMASGQIRSRNIRQRVERQAHNRCRRPPHRAMRETGVRSLPAPRPACC